MTWWRSFQIANIVRTDGSWSYALDTLGTEQVPKFCCVAGKLRNCHSHASYKQEAYLGFTGEEWIRVSFVSLLSFLRYILAEDSRFSQRLYLMGKYIKKLFQREKKINRSHFASTHIKKYKTQKA